ncbi:hypothetical protein PpBr36_07009, partial [Pyricularia pennisetigena]|uniref:hypothetical protein n=1 Tax=Pyricularia pennisetigena TaxID=1578925 RepID=UPI0011520FB9
DTIMPAEVIDLLSSSEPSSPPQAISLSIISPSVLNSPRDHAENKCDGSTVANRSTGLGSHPAEPSEAALSTVTTKRTSGQMQRSQEILFYSDDFDTTIDLSHDVESEDRAVKRARVSGSTEILAKSPTSVTVTTGIGSNQKHMSRQKRASALDPIEFTSSPDPATVRNKGKGRATVMPDDDDPFASSPHVVHRRENIKPSGAPSKESAVPQPSSFQDPFASSSPLQPVKSPPAKAARRPSRQPTAWDPISSSMPEGDLRHRESILSSPVPLPTTGKLTKAQTEVINLLDSDGVSLASLASDDSLPDVTDIAAKVKAGLDARYPSLSKDGRAVVRQPSKSPPPRKRPAAARSKSGRNTTANSATIDSGATAAEKALEKQEKAAARKAESERKRLEVEHARVEKKLEKERAKALAEVNKIRTDKKQSTPEMIVDLPGGLNPRVKLQVETLLQNLQVDTSTSSSPVSNVVRWRRKVTAVYNDDAERWEPAALRLEKEEHVMVLMPAAEFVELARGDAADQVSDQDEDVDNEYISTPTLEDHVSRMQTHFPGSKLIYLIEGMAKWMRSNRTIQNRQFAAGVRSLAAQAPTSSAMAEGSQGSHRRRKPAKQKKTPVYVDEDIIEDALMRLQVIHSALIHHVDTELETAQWICVFTQHISTIPYRRSRDATNDRAAFCMDTGQVRTGDDAGDAYVRMLQQMTRVTPAIAYGIAAEYPTVSKLVDGFESRGPLMLENCRKSTNKDGAFSDRTIGQALSRRLYKVFTGRDEASTDV